MFAPLIIGKDDGQYEHITMALLDSGNLLQQPAINASLHKTLGVKVDKTNVVAMGANQLSIEMFMKILNKWPYEGRIGQHTLPKSRKKWGWDPILKTEGVEFIKPRKKEDGIVQNLESQGTTQEGSTHLTPTDIDHKEPKMTMSSNRTEDTSTLTQVMKLAQLTSSAQHYTQPEPSEGLEPLPDGSLPHKTIPGPKEVPTNTYPYPSSL